MSNMLTMLVVRIAGLNKHSRWRRVNIKFTVWQSFLPILSFWAEKSMILQSNETKLGQHVAYAVLKNVYRARKEKVYI